MPNIRLGFTEPNYPEKCDQEGGGGFGSPWPTDVWLEAGDGCLAGVTVALFSEGQSSCVPYVPAQFVPQGPKAPRIPTSVAYVSAKGTPLCGGSGETWGAGATLTYQLLDQDGLPLNVAGLEVQERLTNEGTALADGSVYPYPEKDSGWVTLTKNGTSLTDSFGEFKDTPFGGCGPGFAIHFGFQQFRVNFNGAWITLGDPWYFSITELPYAAYLHNSIGLDKLIFR